MISYKMFIPGKYINEFVPKLKEVIDITMLI